MRQLWYYKSGHESNLIWGPSSTDASDRTTTIKAYIRSIYPTTDYYEASKPYLQYLNCGLKIRSEYGDLSLTKDVYKAEVTVNGHQTTYTYNQLSSSQKYSIATPYTLRIYREDYEFRTSKYGNYLASAVSANNVYTSYSRDNDLNIIITYKITLKNNSTTTDAVVREILDYSSNTMELKEVHLNTIDGANLLFSGSTAYNSETSYSVSGYNTHFISTSIKLSASGGSTDIYLIYKVNKNSSGYIEKDSTSTWGKVNIAEISAYSLYNIGTSTPTGVVDKNSNPANTLSPDDVDGYEDDTFRTAVRVLLRDEDRQNDMSEEDYRIISGYVWEELNQTSVDGQVVGDGYKTGSDIGAQNVLVKLYEVVTTSDQDYLVDTGLWYRTGSSGYYQFGSKTTYSNGKLVGGDSSRESTDDCYRLHAGRYVVRFIYGDEPDYLVNADSSGTTIKYSGQDYKSAIYTEVGGSDENEVLKSSSFNNYTTSQGGKILSFAKDNEVRRLEVTSYSTTMTYTMDNILKATTQDEKELLAMNTSMYADTKKFEMDIEYYENYSDKTNHVIAYTSSMLLYKVNNINFGLIERPITKLQLMNDITEIMATTSDGSVILDVFYDVTYTVNSDGSISHTTTLNEDKSTGLEKVQSLKRDGYNQGFRYVNVDTDLLQGMTIKLKYRIAIANISEVDHTTTTLDALAKDSRIDLNVEYNNVSVTSLVRDASKIVETFATDGTTRTYEYTGVSGGNNIYITAQALKDSSPTGTYTYDNGASVGSAITRTSYTYHNINKQDSSYYVGSYMGNLYYNGTKTNDIKVETRVDQYIDYIDTDLIFKAEENVNEFGQTMYLTYSASEIATKGLMKGVTNTTTQITNGKQAYYDSIENVNNNLAFNVEDESINSTFYRYLSTSKNLDGELKNNFYYIDIEASRTLTSEADADGLSIENLAEIVKVSNVVGRKVYVSADNNIGYIGDTKPDVETIHRENNPVSIVTVALKETDTDFTELVTFSPPTGLSIAELKADNITRYAVVAVLMIIVVVGTVYVIVQFKKRKKFYK
jgi:hypothetical protein